MTPPQTDTEPPAKARRSALGALGWGFACALCAAIVWQGATCLFHPSLDRSVLEHAQKLPRAAYEIATTVALGGLIAGALAGLPYRDRGLNSAALCGIGAVVGTLGGGFVIQITFACRGWCDALAASTAFWCVIGFVTGFAAHRLSLAHRLSECPRSGSFLIHAALVCALIAFLLSSIAS